MSPVSVSLIAVTVAVVAIAVALSPPDHQADNEVFSTRRTVEPKPEGRLVTCQDEGHLYLYIRLEDGSWRDFQHHPACPCLRR